MKTRGFTLLELLVAITVLSVVSVIAWRGLDTLVKTRDRLEPELDGTRAMLVAFGQMERDLTSVVNPAFLGLNASPVNVRVVDGTALIEVERVAAPAPDRATEVQTVYYRVVDGTLVRQATPALPYFQSTRAEQFEMTGRIGRFCHHNNAPNNRIRAARVIRTFCSTRISKRKINAASNRKKSAIFRRRFAGLA